MRSADMRNDLFWKIPSKDVRNYMVRCCTVIIFGLNVDPTGILMIYLNVMGLVDKSCDPYKATLCVTSKLSKSWDRWWTELEENIFWKPIKWIWKRISSVSQQSHSLTLAVAILCNTSTLCRSGNRHTAVCVRRRAETLCKETILAQQSCIYLSKWHNN